MSRLHQFGSKVLPGIFLGYALHAGGTWKGDVLVADIEELEQMYASEIYAKRLNAKEVSAPMSGEKIIVPIGWNGKTLWRRWMSESIHLHPGTAQTEENNKEIFNENQTDLFQPRFETYRCMMVKQEMISGPCQATLFTVITLNPESHFKTTPHKTFFAV